MANHNDIGKLGEDLAAEFLKKEGYEILERNWFFQKAEVDIIAKKNDILAVVEVKTRTNLDYGDPHDFVNLKKIKLLVKAVDEYVISKNLDFTVRFDIISVTNKAAHCEILHLKDAFYYF
ncbi:MULTISPECIES: YraN family protein [Flavobacterium]|uniref:YraN family protein n=1 Tax=Flavobacterium TaxID=237 RepID=UPI001FCBF16B|nr:MULTISPECIES: YraN family protein [Flavobacterium]UOK43278.1 YraN family protein [Flavobacterium enshiense]